MSCDDNVVWYSCFEVPNWVTQTQPNYYLLTDSDYLIACVQAISTNAPPTQCHDQIPDQEAQTEPV